MESSLIKNILEWTLFDSVDKILAVNKIYIFNKKEMHIIMTSIIYSPILWTQNFFYCEHFLIYIIIFIL